MTFSRPFLLMSTACFMAPMLFGACRHAQAPKHAEPSQTVLSRSYDLADSDALQLPANVAPRHYALALKMDPAAETFVGEVDIDIDVTEPSTRIVLHQEQLNISHASIKNTFTSSINVTDIAPDTSRKTVTLSFSAPLPIGAHVLHITYVGRIRHDLAGLYQVTSGKSLFIFSQFEPISARAALPCFDEPRFKAKFSVKITVPKGNMAVSNGAVVDRKETPEETTFTFAPTPPLPAYVLALMAGPFEALTDVAMPNAVRKEPLPLRGLAVAGQAQRLRRALAATKIALAALETTTQRAYPLQKLDLLAVPDFAYGAMENAGAITFRDSLLLSDVDSPDAGADRGLTYVIAHELVHQWFGNGVTLKWWDDLWLNEGFATWMGYRVANDAAPKLGLQDQFVGGVNGVMHHDGLRHSRKVRQTCLTEGDIYTAFDGITYTKGGGLINMFSRYLGLDKFDKGLRNYLNAHWDQTADSNAFFAAIGTSVGHPEVLDAFRGFLDQAGVPEITFNLSCRKNQAMLHLGQQRYTPLGAQHDDAMWQVPICWRYGTHHQAYEKCVFLDGQHTSVSLGRSCPSWLVPNQDGAGYFRWRLDGQQLHMIEKARDSVMRPPELLSMIENIRAMCNAGTLPVADGLALVEPLLNRPESDVVRASASLVRQIYDEMLDDAGRMRAQLKLRKTIKKALGRLQKSDAFKAAKGQGAHGVAAPQAQLWQRTLAMFAWQMTADPELTRTLANLGEQALSCPKDKEVCTLHRASVRPHVLDLALAAAADRHGIDWTRRLATVLKTSQDPKERGPIIAALGMAHRPEVAQDVRQLALMPYIRVNEVLSLILPSVYDPRLKHDAFRFIVEHLQELLSRLPNKQIAALPATVSTFCDAKKAQDAARVFTEPAGSLSRYAGGERALAESLEAAQLCEARTRAQKQSATQYFAKTR